jgi:hypothetical protein
MVPYPSSSLEHRKAPPSHLARSTAPSSTRASLRVRPDYPLTELGKYPLRTLFGSAPAALELREVQRGVDRLHDEREHALRALAQRSACSIPCWCAHPCRPQLAQVPEPMWAGPGADMGRSRSRCGSYTRCLALRTRGRTRQPSSAALTAADAGRRLRDRRRRLPGPWTGQPHGRAATVAKLARARGALRSL